MCVEDEEPTPDTLPPSCCLPVCSSRAASQKVDSDIDSRVQRSADHVTRVDREALNEEISIFCFFYWRDASLLYLSASKRETLKLVL